MLSPIPPFSLLPAGADRRQACAHAALLCGITESSVQDIYPCTPLQQGLLALTSQRADAYVSRNLLELRPDVDIQRLRSSWDLVVSRNPILRTRIVSLPDYGGLVQVVLADPSPWEFDSDPDEFQCKQSNHSTAMSLGSPLAKFAIIGPTSQGRRYFSWEMHHALYDGWSILLLLQELQDAYEDRLSQPAPPSMPLLIQHIQKSDDATVKNFWQSQFAELQAVPFPRHPEAATLPRPDQEVSSTVGGLDWSRGDFTAATVVRAAWSVALAYQTGSKEALFGVTVTGRQAPVPGIESLAGPTIATVPVRVTLDWDSSGTQLLQTVQTQAADMIPFEQTGLAKIRRLGGEDAAAACDFQTLLVIQPANSGHDISKDDDIFVFGGEPEPSIKGASQGFSTHGIVVECQLDTDAVHFRISYDADLVGNDEITHLVRNVESMLRNLVDEPTRKERLGKTVAEQLSPWGLDQVWTWNAALPPATEACIHELISQWVEDSPLAPAVCAWDGSLTYAQLDSESTSLALRLISHGDGAGVKGKLVPLLFEKSMWTPVAAVAVMKAGGASVLLDQKQPEDRLRLIAAQATSPVMLSSHKNADLARRLIEGTCAVDVEIVAPEKTSTSRAGAPVSVQRPSFPQQQHAPISPPSSTPSSVFSVQSCTSSSSNSSASDLSNSPALSLALPAVSPSDNLYVVYTSGSTGTPKGAVVTHRNFSSAITYQQKPLRYFSNSRVLDFASYAFDAAWWNLCHALTAGGCLCIPSAEERENDLPACFERYNATTVDLTPSVARALGPSVLSRLSALILGGEAVVLDDAALTNYRCPVLNVYGPAECSPTSTFAEVTDHYAGIGRAAGVCTWVVDVDNPDSLAPVGAPGELWLEGPLVGRGYLNEPEKTARAFVDNPSWLLRGAPAIAGQPARPGRRGRVYRTGDLVQYADDGTLMFVGRKDTQVKIRGQRVELGEVERHVRDAVRLPEHTHSYSVQVTAETIQPKGATGVVLVAFLTFENSGVVQTDENMFKQATNGIEDRLATKLPVYMVPTTYIPLQQVPMTATGKTDRKRLRAMGEEMWMQYRDASSEDKDDPAEWLSETEKLLQKVWMTVLNVPLDQASVKKPFLRMGGDSITAMQIVSQCRLHNVSITVSDLLQASTIRALATRYKQKSQQTTIGDEKSQEDEEEVDDVDTNTPFDLSPIQQIFFSAHPDGLDHFNQSFALELRRPIATSDLRDALDAVVARHSMLRARFTKDSKSGTWMQHLVDSSSDSFVFAEHFVQNHDTVMPIFQERQRQLDIQQGPVFACDLFECHEGGQVLALSAHHLIIDLVSWRILWKDIEDYLEHGELRSHKPTSFHAWCKSQAKISRNASPLSVLPISVPEPNISFWGLPWSENTFDNTETWTDALDRATTSALFAECNDTLRTEPIDIILGAMAFSFQQTFPERSVPAVWTEGHGREQYNESLPDATETVGWFTTIKPLPIHISVKDSLLHAIRLAKDNRRSIPGNGQPYFACRHYSESGREAFGSHEFAEIMFNFAGQFQQLENDEGLFKVLDETEEHDDKFKEISTSARRSAMIEINAHTSEGELFFAFQIHKRMKHLDRLEKWLDNFLATMETAVHDLLHAPASFTPSDLSLLSISYSGLDALLHEQLPSMGITTDQVADIYPCSPVQEGVLLSYEKGLASYANYSVFRCEVNKELASQIDPRRLEEAWKKVVKRHTILSTVFCTHPEGHGFIQLVLRNPTVRVNHIVIKSGCPASYLMALERPGFESNEPQHCFTICQSTGEQVACRLDISHAMFDAASESLLIKEIVAAYEGETLAAAPPFSEMIRYIGSTPKAKKLAAWAALLDGVDACEFPTSSVSAHDDSHPKHGDIQIELDSTANIKTFCEEMDITRSVFFQVTWAMVLAYFTGKHDVCFGYLTSGKDAPVDDVETILGPTISLLISRVDLRAPARQILKRISENSVKHLDLQHTPLAEIQHHLGLAGQPLFNTSLSIVANNKTESGEVKTLSCNPVGGADPHEYDLGLSVSMDPVKTFLSLEFREPHVSRQTAQEVGAVLTNAVEFLLGSNELAPCHSIRTNTISSNELLAQSFFKHIVGVDELSTQRFWKDYFSNLEGSHFPSMRVARQSSEEICTIRRTITGFEQQDSSLQTETIVRVAWASVAAKYQDTTEALFGVNKPGTQSVVPHRITLDWNESAQSLLEREHDRAIEMTPFQQLSPVRIHQVSEEAANACDFQTLLNIDVRQDGSNDEEPIEGHRGYPVIFSCQIQPSNMKICVDFNIAMLEKSQVIRLCDQFEHVFLSLSNRNLIEQKLQALVVANQQDLREIWSWNAQVPTAWNECVHNLIAAQVRKQPQAPALEAWDGSLTYEELDTLSTRLAHRLVALGIRVGSVVPLCFEKSVWMPVAVLSVMKAGGASVLIDVATQPESRISTIVTQVGATAILTSISNEALVRRLGVQETIIVGPEQGVNHPHGRETSLPTVEPSATLYVVFTSGTTGVPKGVMVSHRNFCSAIYHQRDSIGYRRDSRVLDFSSYAFDVAWSNLINTLTVGGCLCIPSALERENSVTECLDKYNITLADFTPSFVRHIEPKKQLSRLATMLLGGESVLATDISSVGTDTNIYNAYGPAECTPTSTIQDLTKRPNVNLGRGAGVNTWIVDIHNPSALAPIGTTGELWIEGPVVGQGYLNNPTQTNASFIEDPAWLIQGPDGHSSGRSGRVYRTGDLVQYRPDGSLLFIGRKDSQVKIRGQRLELEEVEHRLHQAIQSTTENSAGGSVHIVAEAVQPKGSSRSILVAFIAMEKMEAKSEAERAVAVHDITDELALPLAELLPAWMIPSVYIPIGVIPRLPTGKVNRRRLREIAANMTMQDIAALGRAAARDQNQTLKQAPTSAAETVMQRLWAEVLHLDQSSISVNDSFFRLGGDSIGAMKLAGLARQQGLLLLVRDVFKAPILRDMARVVEKEEGSNSLSQQQQQQVQ